MRVLVTGGAGYIGSHTVRELIAHGYETVVYDNLSKGHRGAVPGGVKLIEGDIRDGEMLKRVLSEEKIGAVVHFAADSLVGESMTKPAEYYNNNVYGTLSLLCAMKDSRVMKIVFSSTAAVFGESERTPIDEDCPKAPTNVYGRTKLIIEQMLADFDRAYGLRYCALRYFNAAGAHASAEIGEDHSPESHLLPIIMQTALGKREFITVFGSDYPTPDGTCVRDYIHVTDLAEAHILALKHLAGGGASDVFNLGNGKGYSVLQVIEAARRITGSEIPVRMGERRAGDPAVLVASSEKIMKLLGWQPKYAALDSIVESAWRWHSTHPDGFGA